MAIYIGRREFIVTLGGASAWPLGARAQQSDRMQRIGVLMQYAESDPVFQDWVATSRDGLAKLGWLRAAIFASSIVRRAAMAVSCRA